MDVKTRSEVLKNIQPTISALLRKIEKLDPNLCFSAFIYGIDPPTICHFSNTNEEGGDLVQLHYQLAYLLVAKSRNIDLLQSVEDISDASGPTPEEVADKLVLSLIASPPEGMSEEIKELMNQYLKIRRGETD